MQSLVNLHLLGKLCFTEIEFFGQNYLILQDYPVTVYPEIRQFMFKKKKDLYYLLPGMGRAASQKFFRNLKISILVGLLTAGGMALLLHFKDKL